MNSVNETKQNVKLTLHNGESSQQLDDFFYYWLMLDAAAEAAGYEDVERNRRADEAYEDYCQLKKSIASGYVTEPHYTHADYFSGDYGRW